MRKTSTAICFSCDEVFFGLAKGLVLSLRHHFKSAYDLHFIDVGVSSSSRRWLKEMGVRSVKFDPNSVVKGFFEKGYPAYVAAMICRPTLPTLVPGYETYVWIDTDAWVQEPDTVRSFIAAAQTGMNKIAIATEDPWVYNYSASQIEGGRAFVLSCYGSVFGNAVAATYFHNRTLNAGFFALSGRSRIWDWWKREVERVYARGLESKAMMHMAEQVSLNYICYSRNCYVEFHALHNFMCHVGNVERHNGRVRRVGDEQYRIGIVHLTLTGNLSAKYLADGLLYDEGRYLTEAERQSILKLSHFKVM